MRCCKTRHLLRWLSPFKGKLGGTVVAVVKDGYVGFSSAVVTKCCPGRETLIMINDKFMENYKHDASIKLRWPKVISAHNNADANASQKGSTSATSIIPCCFWPLINTKKTRKLFLFSPTPRMLRNPSWCLSTKKSHSPPFPTISFMLNWLPRISSILQKQHRLLLHLIESSNGRMLVSLSWKPHRDNHTTNDSFSLSTTSDFSSLSPTKSLEQSSFRWRLFILWSSSSFW